MIEIDGTYGEGGGQMLRSSLTLSMITGKPFRMTRIRAGRSKPGLLRQHLTATRAAEQICGGRTNGADLGSGELVFRPGPIRPGDYSFAVGTAGSAVLVLQTIVPALLTAGGPSRIQVTGGTHNPAAPTFDYFQRVWIPLVSRMGPRLEAGLDRPGFFPVGGGTASCSIQPSNALTGFDLTERGPRESMSATSLSCKVPGDVGRRALSACERELDLRPDALHLRRANALCSGYVLSVETVHQQVREMVTVLGSRGKPAELIARNACNHVRDYLQSQAAVGPYLADQLMLLLALAGEGRFTTSELTDHFTSNAYVINKFLRIRFRTETLAPDKHLVVCES